MNLEQLIVKDIDESKQGESLNLKNSSHTFRKMYIESYGCQMNFSDSEIVASILTKEGFTTTQNISKADLVLVNTCSVREKAEQTIRKRLEFYNSIKKKENKGMMVGVLGCMAERLKDQFLEEEKLVDIVIGPDSYRDLPNLIKQVDDGRKAVNVILSKEETYADISPVRLGGNGVTSFVSITRGCDNMCTFCVVPFTRGRERSRDTKSIINECKQLVEDGYKEVTLLGQNVDSYLWYGGGPKKDFERSSKKNQKESVNFAMLLDRVANTCPDLRIRFSTSNPQDFNKEVIETMAKHKNICKYIHLPVQSGSSRVLEVMKRGYSREEYVNLIDLIRSIIPDCAISMDMIAGFCTETEEDHQKTLSLMDYVKYDYGYMFNYSVRPSTPASRLKDDVPKETKQRRLSEIIDKQMKHSLLRNKEKVGNTYEVLVEGKSKKSDDFLYGRTTYNSVVVFPKENHNIGDFVMVKVNECTAATLKGKSI